jgi:acyl-CoA thioester hydrolase
MTAVITCRIDVAWGEMDAFGHVNNVVYLRWFETARIAWLRHHGLLDRMETERQGPILARSEIDYRVPVVFPDTVEVSVRAERIGSSSVTLAYALRSEARGAVVAEGKTVVVMFDYGAGRAVPWTPAQRAAIGLG